MTGSSSTRSTARSRCRRRPSSASRRCRSGSPRLVRICAGALDEGTRALDNGALGIVVPHVNTAEQARDVAQAFHYPPRGHRSWGGPPAIFGFQPPGSAEAQAIANDEILIAAMIESPEAVENAESIAEVEGIDALLIGTSDLTAEMGISGQMAHARVQEAYRRVGAACAQAWQVSRDGRRIRPGERGSLPRHGCAAHSRRLGPPLSVGRRGRPDLVPTECHRGRRGGKAALGPLGTHFHGHLKAIRLDNSPPQVDSP